MKKLAVAFVVSLLLAALGHPQGEARARQPSPNLSRQSPQTADASIPPDLLRALERTRPNLRQAATGGLGEADQTRLQLVIALLRERREDEGLSEWQLLLASTTQAQPPVDPEALVQFVLREAYLENAGELSEYASKVEYFNQARRELRGELRHARDLQAVHGQPGARFPPEGVEVREPTLAAPEGQSVRLTFSKRRLASPQDCADYAAALEAVYQQVGDDGQLATTDLQNALQKQQQMLQLMSKVSKALRDAAMAIIRKIG